MIPGDIEYSYQNSYLNVLNLKRFGKVKMDLEMLAKRYQLLILRSR